MYEVKARNLLEDLWKYARGEVTKSQLDEELKPTNDEVSIEEVEFGTFQYKDAE